jgi:hypothetical protein
MLMLKATRKINLYFMLIFIALKIVEPNLDSSVLQVGGDQLKVGERSANSLTPQYHETFSILFDEIEKLSRYHTIKRSLN